MQLNNEPPNAFQAPQCSICHELLINDLNSLHCGHVFHYVCIIRQFQYKSSCPNCQQKISQKQLRKLIYQLEPLGSKSDRQVDKILASLNTNQKNQFQIIIQQLKKANQAKQKSQYQNFQLKSANKKLDNQNKTLKSQLDNTKKQFELVKRQKNKMGKQITDLYQQKNRLNKQLSSADYQISLLRQKQLKYKNFEQAKQNIKKNSQEIVRLKNQMYSQQMNPQHIAETFYQMVLMKNNEILKYKQKMRIFPSKIDQLQKQLGRQKDYVNKCKSDYARIFEEKQKYRGRYEQLKIKYKQLRELSKKQNRMNDQQDQYSIGFSNQSKKNIPSLLQIQKIQQVPRALLQKKVSTTQFGGIGGIKKKCQIKQKTLTSFGGFNLGKKV